MGWWKSLSIRLATYLSLYSLSYLSFLFIPNIPKLFFPSPLLKRKKKEAEI